VWACASMWCADACRQCNASCERTHSSTRPRTQPTYLHPLLCWMRYVHNKATGSTGVKCSGDARVWQVCVYQEASVCVCHHSSVVRVDDCRPRQLDNHWRIKPTTPSLSRADGVTWRDTLTRVCRVRRVRVTPVQCAAERDAQPDTTQDPASSPAPRSADSGISHKRATGTRGVE
jgi:hypothetical protein